MTEKRIIYLNEEMVQDIYLKTMEVSESTYSGIINPDTLESVLTQIQNDLYYPTFISKLSRLFIAITKFHCFQDGNKRSAIALSVGFLLFNGYSNVLSDFINVTENIVVLLAANVLSEEDCTDIICAVIEGSYNDDESLKLLIIKAMKDYEEMQKSFL